MLRCAEPGSVSCGTLNPVDLLEAFHDELEYQLGRQERTPENIAEIDDLWQVYWDCSEACWGADDGSLTADSETMEVWIDSLANALCAFSPIGYTFSAHVGDGADFGYWTVQWEASF